MSGRKPIASCQREIWSRHFLRIYNEVSGGLVVRGKGYYRPWRAATRISYHIVIEDFIYLIHIFFS